VLDPAPADDLAGFHVALVDVAEDFVHDEVRLALIRRAAAEVLRDEGLRLSLRGERENGGDGQ
jgi:hypothetical protein